jgi:hypothetical protein
MEIHMAVSVLNSLAWGRQQTVLQCCWGWAGKIQFGMIRLPKYMHMIKYYPNTPTPSNTPHHHPQPHVGGGGWGGEVGHVGLGGGVRWGIGGVISIIYIYIYMYISEV